MTETNTDCPQDSVIIVVETQEFTIRREILTECSPYFRSLLDENFKESRETEIEIMDVAAQWFQILLEYIEEPEIAVQAHHAIELLLLADRFQITSLMVKCEQCIKKNFDRDSIDKFRLLDIVLLLNREKIKADLWMHFYLQLSKDFEKKHAIYSNPKTLFLFDNQKRIESLTLEAQSFILKCITHVEFKKARLLLMKNYQDSEIQRLNEENVELACELVRSIKKAKELEGKLTKLNEVMKDVRLDTPDHTKTACNICETPKRRDVSPTKRHPIHDEIASLKQLKKSNEFIELPTSSLNKESRLSKLSKVVKRTFRRRIHRQTYDFTK